MEKDELFAGNEGGRIVVVLWEIGREGIAVCSDSYCTHGVDIGGYVWGSSKVHFLLVSTLNSAFPDNDFSSLRPDHFTRERSAAQVLGHLSGSLLGRSGDSETS